MWKFAILCKFGVCLRLCKIEFFSPRLGMKLDTGSTLGIILDGNWLELDFHCVGAEYSPKK
jgi:hypothetical protein